ncbi:MAG: hypothetical protein MRY74_16870 [Neomegalonema sp.]|nr:hypothetical protein [Neomegalonema sp.]
MPQTVLATQRTGTEAAELDYSPAEKAAIVLMAIGREDAEPLLREFSEEEVRSFARASAQLGEVPSWDIERIVGEFLVSLDDKRITMTSDKLKEFLSSILSDDAIERILEDLDDSDGQSIWEKLSSSDPVDLSNFLAREHPQTVAVVLSRIKPDSSAQVLQRLEKEFAEEVIVRIANVSILAPAVMDKVKESIEFEFLRGARLRKSKRDPDELIGSMFNFMSSDKRDTLLAGLEERSPDLAQAVQRKMFTFGDIPARVDRSSVSFIMREIENDVLLKALCFAKKNAPESKDFFLGNMSRRLAEQFEEQVNEMPTPNVKDGEAAQFAVIGVIRKMAEVGEIELHQPEDEEIDGD